MNTLFEGIIIFLMMAAVDVCWTLYIKSVSDGQKLKAAFFSAFIILLGGFSVIAYTEKPILLFAAALGAFFGTYITAGKSTK